MDLRRLRSFVTVAEQGTVSKAAVRLHISQPGLSRQIQELQHELGLRLFDHVGRRLVLTPEGEQLLGSCREFLGQASAIWEKAQSLKRGDAGPLTVAASAIQIETTLSTFLPRYAARYPRVQLKLIESSGLNTLAMLERGEIHLGIALVDAAEANRRNLATYPVRPLELPAWPAEPVGVAQPATLQMQARTPLVAGGWYPIEAWGLIVL